MVERDRLRLSTAQIAQLATLLDGEGARTLYLDTVRGRLAIEIAPASEQLDSVAVSEQRTTVVVCAPTVGAFLTTHPHRESPTVQVGTTVAPGDLLGFLRIGPLIAPVRFEPKSDRGGVIAEVIAENGALVGYGAALFEVVQR